MIDKFMQVMAPKNALGFVVRLILLIAFVAAANLVFSAIVYDHGHPPVYYLAHAAFVGGPLIAFFLAVSVFQIKLQRRLWALSHKDPLTGLDNRRSFFERCELARQSEPQGVLLILDADRFKSINDTYGHGAGDRCLKALAVAIRQGVRKGDIIGRIGGEEFAVYLRDTTPDQAQTIGERLTLPIAFQTREGVPLKITLSIGAVISSKDTTLDELFAEADKALYQAKVGGRARLVFAESDLAA